MKSQKTAVVIALISFVLICLFTILFCTVTAGTTVYGLLTLICLIAFIVSVSRIILQK